MSTTPNEPVTPARRGPRSPSLAQTIGGVLVAFDEQVFGRRPPGQEAVEQIDRLRSVGAEAGLTIELPDDLAPAADHPGSPRAGGR